jgi:hypothetical protein
MNSQIVLHPDENRTERSIACLMRAMASRKEAGNGPMGFSPSRSLSCSMAENSRGRCCHGDCEDVQKCPLAVQELRTQVVRQTRPH